ncbi:MAG: hypothetical protein M3024_04430 [Candidatus Dormibacteraeota bacterium]|nr:hypothetical protein [Candidatus Dormibacteraeota bacterium]MDQ6900271.1 hypothetical protein [Candidatus Dormibacteraeota bacterium]
MNCERLQAAAFKTVLGLTPPEELPGTAAAALGDGCDSPSLRALAGLADGEIEEVNSLFEMALAEVELSLPTAREAAMALARDIASKVLEGVTTPYRGAKQIWEISMRLPDEHLPQLDTFIYGASEWEERPADRNLFAEGIVVAAHELVDT